MLSPIVISVLALFVYQALVLVGSDGSGATKLDVLKRIAEIAPALDFKKFIFGCGINEGNYTYSYEEGAYSHLLFPMVLGQFGLLGIILYVLFFCFIYYITKGYIFIFVFSASVVGLSYLHPFLESIFLVNGILLGLFYKVGLHQVDTLYYKD